MLSVPMQATLSEARILLDTCKAILQYFASWQEDSDPYPNGLVLQFEPKFYLLLTPFRL